MGQTYEETDRWFLRPEQANNAYILDSYMMMMMMIYIEIQFITRRKCRIRDEDPNI
jgi:hypothetical protein